LIRKVLPYCKPHPLTAILCVEQALGLAGMLWSGRWTSALAAAAASASLAVPSAEGGVLVPGPQRDGLSCGARAGCMAGWSACLAKARGGL
jgi:hypothetical protein